MKLKILSVGDHRKIYIDDNNFIWIRNNCRMNATYFKCRRKKCVARARFKGGQLILSAEHNHESDIDEIKRLSFKSKVQKRAKEEPTSLAEIYKQELSKVDEPQTLKFKSNMVAMCRARAKEFPPTPKSIAELGGYLFDEKYKDRLVYSYNEEKREFFKACLQCEDQTTLVLYMSPIFEDFARTGVHLRLQLDASFKIKLNCDEPAHYVVIHMYVGNILYPFVHIITNNKNQYAYDATFKFMDDLIPNLNVELLVSNDQDAIEAAYMIFPKAVKSYYQQEEKDLKKDNLNDLEFYQKDLTKILNRPKHTFWRFIEVLKEIEYNKMCYFLELQNKRIPGRTPKSTRDAEVQISYKNYWSFASTQTNESSFPQNRNPIINFKTNVPIIKKQILVPPNRINTVPKITPSIKPNFSSKFAHVKSKRFIKKPTILTKSISSKPSPKPMNLQNINKIREIRNILENFKDGISNKKFESKPITIKKLDKPSEFNSWDSRHNEDVHLDILIDPNDLLNESTVSSQVGSVAIEALKVLNVLKKDRPLSNKPMKRPVVILNPKSLSNDIAGALKNTKVIKITKSKPLVKRVSAVKSLATLCKEVLFPDHDYA